MSAPGNSHIRRRKYRAFTQREKAKSTSQWVRFTSPATWVDALHPVLQAFLWIMLASWGAFASLWSDSIKDVVLPFSATSSGEPNLYTIGFGVSGVVLAVTFAISQWAGRYQDNIIIESTLTMPPHDFWDTFGTAYEVLAETTEKEVLSLLGASGATKKDVVASAQEQVRRILDTLINMARSWDGVNIDGQSVIYRANIMRVWRFRDKEGNGVEAPTRCHELAKAFSVAPAESHYTGYVGILDTVYTTTTETQTPTPDPRCKPLAFPYTREDDVCGIDYPLLPNILGAPKAAAIGLHSYVKDVTDIVDSYKAGPGTKDDAILSELMRYYSDVSIAQSILSVPLKLDGEVDWVVNMYRNQSGMLFDGYKVRDYVNIIAPHLHLLQVLLMEIEDVVDENPSMV
ncbi:hypothetical protein QWI17_19945 [Gilvimarinus sp. SDUM040013]|uniref:Uncharacterized protein n=1 Tax=Gilvimarinus gilvus TaxID=3058038 RepID=A0ABU4RZK9_9GAMM|nr:hypothetical protein [Gilvimarinus sp. SDUM040013]MDO3388128.1 hypothetical protein [Gilvimarinus sp. SDUM040013]MDX6850297.1 hypothetical protein [Gilvimarinus sp. SDUM040013]